jgi:hypothetical protein
VDQPSVSRWWLPSTRRAVGAGPASSGQQHQGGGDQWSGAGVDGACGGLTQQVVRCGDGGVAGQLPEVDGAPGQGDAAGDQLDRGVAGGAVEAGTQQVVAGEHVVQRRMQPFGVDVAAQVHTRGEHVAVAAAEAVVEHPFLEG